MLDSLTGFSQLSLIVREQQKVIHITNVAFDAKTVFTDYSGKVGKDD